MTKRALYRTLEREREAFTAERRHLIETICRLAGSPSQPTDLDLHVQAQRDLLDDVEVSYTFAPEQDVV